MLSSRNEKMNSLFVSSSRKFTILVWVSFRPCEWEWRSCSPFFSCALIFAHCLTEGALGLALGLWWGLECLKYNIVFGVFRSIPSHKAGTPTHLDHSQFLHDSHILHPKDILIQNCCKGDSLSEPRLCSSWGLRRFWVLPRPHEKEITRPTPLSSQAEQDGEISGYTMTKSESFFLSFFVLPRT